MICTMKRMVPAILISGLSVMLFSCASGSADNKVPELANDMCGCFDKFQQGLTTEGIALMKEVAVSGDPQATMVAGMSKLNPEDVQEFGKKMSSIGDKSSAVYKCMEAFDKKHGKETTKDKKTLTEKLLTEMQGKTNCPVGAAIVNLSLAKERAQ
jgi:hypothetical protein